MSLDNLGKNGEGQAAEPQGVMKVIGALDAGLNRVELFFMFTASLLLFGNMTWGVFARYVFHIPAPYTEELSIMFYIWVTFWGVSYLISQNAHPAMTMFSDKVKRCSNPLFRKCYFTFIYGVMLFFVALACGVGLPMLPLYLTQKTISLGISYILLYGMGVLVLAVMCFRCLFKIIEVWVGEK